MLVNEAMLTLFSGFILQLKNMWKFPGGLSEPGEDIGVYPLHIFNWLENVQEILCLLFCCIAENKILNFLTKRNFREVTSGLIEN